MKRQVVWLYGQTTGLSPFTSSLRLVETDRKSTRLNSSHSQISYAVFCLKKKKARMYLSGWSERCWLVGLRMSAPLVRDGPPCRSRSVSAASGHTFSPVFSRVCEAIEGVW